MLHKHRIKPGHEDGVYEDGNVVLLTPTRHAMWHFAEWQRKGKWEDRVAWRALAGLASQEEVVATVLSEAGKKGGRNVIRDEGYRQRMSEANTGKRRTAEQKAKMSERLMGHQRHTLESREKSRRSNKGQRRSAEARQKMRDAKRDTTNIGAHLRSQSSTTKRANARKGALKNHGWNGTYSSAADFRTSLSETFVEYYAIYGAPGS